jgi:hypothetical protein
MPIFNTKLINKTSLLSTLANIHRNISVVVTGSISNLKINASVGLPDSVDKFKESVKIFLEMFKLYYPLTNRSSLYSTVLSIFKFIFCFPFILSTNAYNYLVSSCRAVTIPVGIAKFLDYICIPVRKTSNGNDANSVISGFYFHDNVKSFIYIIENKYLHPDPWYTDYEIEQSKKSKFSEPLINTKEATECNKNLNELTEIICNAGYRQDVHEVKRLLESLVL